MWAHFQSVEKKQITKIDDLLTLCETKLFNTISLQNDEKQSQELALTFLKSKLCINFTDKLTKNELQKYSAPFLKDFCKKAQIDFGKKPKKEIENLIIEKQKQNTTIPLLFNQFKLDNLLNFELLNLPQIKEYCKACNVQSEGSKDTLTTRLQQFMKTFAVKVDEKTQFLLNCYVYIKHFGCIPVFLFKAIRRNNFDLRMAILKESIKLFQCGKSCYLSLVTEHLFHFQFLYPLFFKELMKEMWVVKTERSHNFLALDEFMEMKHNKYLKKSVKVAEAKHIKKVSKLASVTMEIIGIFKDFLGINKSNSLRKSEDLPWSFVEDLRKIETSPKGLHISSLMEMGKDVTEEELEVIMKGIIDKTSQDYFEK